MNLRFLFNTAFFLVAAWLIGLFVFTTIIPGTPATDTVRTDAIVVLTGGGLRLEHGFELLAAGRAPRMFVSGVEDGVTLNALLKKKEYGQYADKIAPYHIALGYQARSTIGNAYEIADWVRKEHVKSIRLVTGNYHMPRSIVLINQAVPDLIIIPEPVFPKHFENNGWWLYNDSIRLVISEYNKYMISLLLHKAE